tara:strand:- start:4736 stop:5020 length:285 start_codon:yes stop_codon:yes gene_type:complete
MTKKLTFTVTKDPSIAIEDSSMVNNSAGIIFTNYVNEGKILSSDVILTSDPNVTTDEIIFKDSASYQSYIDEIHTFNDSNPLNTGFTASDFVIS